MNDTTVKTRGALKPDLQITITDANGLGDFSSLTTSEVSVVGEMDGFVIFDSPASVVEPSPDGKSCIVKRAWAADDVDVAGRLWVSVRVEWSPDVPQYFPHDGPLRIDIVRAPGDA